MPLKWEEKLSLGFSEIDNQHRFFVDTLRELYEAIYSGSLNNRVGEIFERLEKYAAFHFETEEKYFKKFNYLGAAEHELEHKKFRERIAALKEEMKSDVWEASTKLVDELENWLVNHLQTMDAKYITCFKEHGL